MRRRRRAGRRESRRGPGRPKKPAEDLRHHQIRLLLTNHELEKLEALAAEAGIPVARMAHRLFAASLSRRPLPRR